MGYSEIEIKKLENSLYEKMLNKFEKGDNKILICYKKRALASLVNELVQKRRLTNIDEWKLIKKELYVNSGVEELTNYVVEKYASNIEENVKKRIKN